MNLETVFSLANGIMMLLWLGLIVSVWWPKLQRPSIAAGQWLVPLLLGVAYIAFLIPAMMTSSGSASSLAGVAALFGDERLMLAGWLHYLVFDFFVGVWILRTAVDESISRVLTTLTLPPTFLAGPLGLLLFVLVRAGTHRARQAD